ncbi:hypothetical protein [Lignipirellula cremea]|uniref:hypothetical protein n=1 Tax=Lignipirellula cremea TaxID=2528010 RepID=UPI00119CC8CC|nr:hypothetical protein [Lignipirellula cremea]
MTAELVAERGQGKAAGESWWRFTWQDTQTTQTHTGRLEGLRDGKSGVFSPVHAHTFVAPDGATFAVWNPNVLAPRPNNVKAPDVTQPESRDFAGFSHRLTIYRRTGEIVKRLDLRDFLNDDDWNWLFCYQSQVYWQANFPDLTRDNAPRVGYALYQISPDYTVLETLVGATDEAARKAKERGATPPTPRLVRVDLITGKFLPADALLPPNKTPVRPFVGMLGRRGSGENGQANYAPSLDPVRVEGAFRIVEDGSGTP